jgi:HSP20 family protein
LTRRATDTGTDPDRHLALLRERINRLFDVAAARGSMAKGPDADAQWSPLVDLYETEDKVVLVAEVPGLSMKDLEVQVSDSSLTLRGRRETSPPAKGSQGQVQHHRLERAHGSFSRTFQLMAAIDRENVKADYRNGILHVVLPKRRTGQPRSVRISKN